MKWRHLAVAATSMFVLMTACKHDQPESPPNNSGTAHSVIETVAATRQQVTNQLILAAKVLPNPTSVVHIYPPISGRVV
jgi:cobalt-zinc-cadmium efflux system membrane fusion protein